MRIGMHKKVAIIFIVFMLSIMTVACGAGDRNSDEVQGTTQDTAGMI